MREAARAAEAAQAAAAEDRAALAAREDKLQEKEVRLRPCPWWKHCALVCGRDGVLLVRQMDCQGLRY